MTLKTKRNEIELKGNKFTYLGSRPTYIAELLQHLKHKQDKPVRMQDKNVPHTLMCIFRFMPTRSAMVRELWRFEWATRAHFAAFRS